MSKNASPKVIQRSTADGRQGRRRGKNVTNDSKGKPTNRINEEVKWI